MSPDPWLSPADVATELAVSTDTVLRACKRGAAAGGIDAFQPPGARVVRIRRSELDRYIAAHTGPRDQITARRRRRPINRTA